MPRGGALADRTIKRAPRPELAAAPAFDLEAHVFYLFTQIFGRRNRHLTDGLKALHITVPKWRILAVLHERPNCTMNCLADLTTVDRTTLTRTLDQMVRDRLVARLTDANDRRSVRLKLTPEGDAIFARILPQVSEQNERAMLGLDAMERASLRAMLHRMVRNLDPDYDNRNAAWQSDHAASIETSRRRKGRPRMTRVPYIAATAALALLLGAGPALAAEPIKIGLDLEFSAGPYVPLANEVADALALAIADNGNAVDGRKIEIIRGDNAHKPDVAQSVAKRLIFEDKADMIVGSIGSGVVKVIRDVAVQAKEPMIIPNAGDDEITGADCNFWVVRTSFSNDQIVRDMGPYLAKHGHKRVSLIAFDYAAGHQMMDGFRRTFTKAGGTIVNEQYPPFGPISDFGPYLTKIKSSAPDAVFTFFAGPPATAFVKQYTDFGLKKTIQLTGPGWIISPLNLPSEGTAAADVLAILNYLPSLNNPVNKKFQKEFEAKYHHVGSEFAAQGYDTGLLILAALKKTGGKTADKAAFVRALHSVSVEGTRGKLRIDPKTNNIIQNLYIYKTILAGDKVETKVLETIPAVQDPPNGCKL